VIFVTAQNDTDSEVRALNAGAHDFIHTPIRSEVVRTRVQNSLQLSFYKQNLEQLVETRTRELAEARDRAESASRAKSTFLSNMNHELRTPLHQIMCVTELLSRKLGDDYSQQRLQMMHQSSKHLLSLIEGLLDVARLEAEEIKISNHRLDLTALAEHLRTKLHAEAFKKGLTLVTEVLPGVPKQLCGDREHLRKILEQLLKNAIKFSERGMIALRIKPTNTRHGLVGIRFEVSDQGIGISTEIQSALFELFQQGDNSTSRKFSVLGAGLSLCKRLVSLMGGTMGYDSELGQGSTFWVELYFTLSWSSQSECEKAAVDWQRVRQVVSVIEPMLLEYDFNVIDFCQRARDPLSSLLDQRLPEFIEAVEEFELNTALKLLHDAIAETPELALSK